MSRPEETIDALIAENIGLRMQLEESREMLDAIRRGDLDGLVVDTENGPSFYVLQSADVSSSHLRGEMLAQVSDAVLCYDAHHRLTYMNAAAEQLYGLPTSRALGQPLTSIFTAIWRRPEDKDAAEITLSESGRWRGENIHQTRDGRKCDVESSVTKLRDLDGSSLGFLAVIRDITARRAAEEALKKADRRKDEFLAVLAHELRNPLATIRSGLEILRIAGHDPNMVERVRAPMERQTLQLVTLIDDLLDVSRITRGKLELRRARVDLADVIQSGVEASRPCIDEAGHHLTIQAPGEPIYLVADPNRLAQVVSNLLNNAAQYTPDGGQITLSAAREEGKVVIRVKDTGVGIPPQMQDRIFEMFAQIDRPPEKGYSGLGIGLTLVKSLVEMHGGRISVYSEGPDQGSEFTVELPTGEGTGAADAPAEIAAPVGSKGSRRVLVVDDNAAAADLLAMTVMMLGHEARTAHDGQEAVALAAEFMPEVVLMDLGMPKMNGYEAARSIRAQEWGRRMRLVALTGWGQEEDKRRTKEAGFDEHFVKPVEPSVLQELFAALG